MRRRHRGARRGYILALLEPRPTATARGRGAAGRLVRRRRHARLPTAGAWDPPRAPHRAARWFHGRARCRCARRRARAEASPWRAAYEQCGAGRRAKLRCRGQGPVSGASRPAATRARTAVGQTLRHHAGSLRADAAAAAPQREPRTYAAFLQLLQRYRADEAGAAETAAAVAKLFRRNTDLADAFARFLPAGVTPTPRPARGAR